MCLSLYVLIIHVYNCIIYTCMYLMVYKKYQFAMNKSAFISQNHPHLVPVSSQVIFGNQVVDVTSPTESCR